MAPPRPPVAAPEERGSPRAVRGGFARLVVGGRLVRWAAGGPGQRPGCPRAKPVGRPTVHGASRCRGAVGKLADLASGQAVHGRSRWAGQFVHGGRALRGLHIDS